MVVDGHATPRSIFAGPPRRHHASLLYSNYLTHGHGLRAPGPHLPPANLTRAKRLRRPGEVYLMAVDGASSYREGNRGIGFERTGTIPRMREEVSFC